MTETYPAPYEVREMLACTDCLCLLANGDTEGVAAIEWHPDPDVREALRYRAPSPDETAEAEAAYLAAVESHDLAAEGWTTSPGCPGCEWCRECPTCGTCEAEHDDPDDIPDRCEIRRARFTGEPVCERCAADCDCLLCEDGARLCPGPTSWEDSADRADYCPNDEGAFSWAGCDVCGSALGATLYPCAAVYVPTQDRRRDPVEAREAEDRYRAARA